MIISYYYVTTILNILIIVIYVNFDYNYHYLYVNMLTYSYNINITVLNLYSSLCIINMTNDEYPMININDIITITVIIVITNVIYL